MLSFTVPNYTDLYVGEKPILEKLLEGIPSKVVISILAILNSELYLKSDKIETQAQLFEVISQNFPKSEKYKLQSAIQDFIKKLKGERFTLWAKRYILEYMQYVFLNYNSINSINSTPEQEVNIVKGYLLITEELNERDRLEFKQFRNSQKVGEEYFFERIVWPFTLKQFDTNNQVNPVYNFFNLLGFLKFILAEEELSNYFKKYLLLNGFETIRNFMGSISELIKIAQHQNLSPENKLEKFAWIKPNDFVLHLENLSINIEAFKNDKTKQVDYKGLRETPLFKVNENEYIILDIDFLNNKIYYGQIFDMYFKTGMEGHTYKTFPDFKSTISKKVSEEILFKGLLTALFKKKNIVIYFDDNNKDGSPDCYIRSGESIFIIEFKDYLFPGKLVGSYSFEDIKNHVDQKFILNQNKKNKGVNQLIEQIKTIARNGFDFDDWVRSKNQNK